jgi:hypothetical protein
MTEEQVTTVLGKIIDRVVDRKSAEEVCEDGSTVHMLLQLLRSPNNSKACAVWAPSKLLHTAASATGMRTL